MHVHSGHIFALIMHANMRIPGIDALYVIHNGTLKMTEFIDHLHFTTVQL